jgi:hypothetical protein
MGNTMSRERTGRGTSDPKPQLSKAAIQCNIDYYAARKQQASCEYKTARAEQRHWQQILKDLNELHANFNE